MQVVHTLKKKKKKTITITIVSLLFALVETTSFK